MLSTKSISVKYIIEHTYIRHLHVKSTVDGQGNCTNSDSLYKSLMLIISKNILGVLNVYVSMNMHLNFSISFISLCKHNYFYTKLFYSLVIEICFWFWGLLIRLYATKMNRLFVFVGIRIELPNFCHHSRFSFTRSMNLCISRGFCENRHNLVDNRVFHMKIYSTRIFPQNIFIAYQWKRWKKFATENIAQKTSERSNAFDNLNLSK